MKQLRSILPGSLKGQFNLALAALVILIIGAEFVAIRSLDETADASRQLSEERLTLMEDAQLLVRTAVLIEKEAQGMQLVPDFDEMRGRYNRVLEHLEKLDDLVSRLGQAGHSIFILEFQKSAQLFRGDVHVLAKLHEQVVRQNVEPEPNSALFARLNLFNRNLVEQGQLLLSASEALSNDFSNSYRQEVLELTENVQTSRLKLLALLGGSLLVAWLISAEFLGKIVISRLQKVSNYLRSGQHEINTKPHVPVSGNDEIAQMARAVENYMLARQQLAQAQQDASQTARFVAVGQLAAGIAHEINTPAQYIGNNLRFMLTTIREMANDPVCQGWHDDLEEMVAAISESEEGVQHISSIVVSMKEFSHPGVTERIEADINRALENVITVSQSQWKNIAMIERDFDPNLPSILCDLGKVNQVFLNLIVNAAQAIEASGKAFPGKISIKTRRMEISSKSGFPIAVPASKGMS